MTQSPRSNTPYSSDNEVHISSLVAHVKPEAMAHTRQRIDALPGAEIFAESPEGKLVVVIESRSHSSVTDVIESISKFKGVLNTALVYHQIESSHTIETTL